MRNCPMNIELYNHVAEAPRPIFFWSHSYNIIFIFGTYQLFNLSTAFTIIHVTFFCFAELHADFERRDNLGSAFALRVAISLIWRCLALCAVLKPWWVFTLQILLDTKKPPKKEAIWR
jgi:hypothetical protein